MLLVAIHALLLEIINLVTYFRKEIAECQQMIHAMHEDIHTKLEVLISKTEKKPEVVHRSVENGSRKWDKEINGFDDHVSLAFDEKHETVVSPTKSEATSWNGLSSVFDGVMDTQFEYESPFAATPDVPLCQFSEAPIRNLNTPIKWQCAFSNYVQPGHNEQLQDPRYYNNIPEQQMKAELDKFISQQIRNDGIEKTDWEKVLPP